MTLLLHIVFVEKKIQLGFKRKIMYSIKPFNILSQLSVAIFLRWICAFISKMWPPIVTNKMESISGDIVKCRIKCSTIWFNKLYA